MRRFRRRRSASEGAGEPRSAISRRDFFRGLGRAAAAAPFLLERDADAAGADGTPEQIHLTFGDDPARAMNLSWVCAAPADRPRVHLSGPDGKERLVFALPKTYTDGMNGQTVFTYHAGLAALEPDARYAYRVTADNDARREAPFTGSFRTAPVGRRGFRWTSYGDLSTPNTAWALSSPQSRAAVDAVERFDPLFHLLNGDLCYANLNPMAQPAVWADFGRNIERSAAHRAWMPCPGNHEIEFGNGAQGLEAYLTRFALPANGTAFPGRWYRFRVGSALFISLAADDVIYQDSGAFNAGPHPLVPAASTGHAPIPPGTSIYVRGYSEGAQTRWLEATLAAAARDTSLDWIIVQMHQDALSSSLHGNGSDRGIRETWLPLFDRYGVDLVLCGHDHDYERSWPVRGATRGVGRDALTGAPVDTCRPEPVIRQEPADSKFDARVGTIHLVLGGGGTNSPLDAYGVDPLTGAPQAKVITRTNRPKPGPEPGLFVKDGADALEAATWSARRDTVSGYGIGVFDLDPGVAGGETSIEVRWFHAPGADRGVVAAQAYEVFDRITLVKPRRDGSG